MTYAPPSLAEILANEQTLNTNLISFRSELRDALDTLGISYESSDTVLDLIRLLDWTESKAINIGSNFDNEKVLELISNRIAMVTPAATYTESYYGSGWQLAQSSAAPDYRFIPYTLAYFGGGGAGGNATGVWVFTNEETSFTLNQNWTYDCYIYPESGKSGTDVYRGLAILVGSDWQDYSTYKGWCAGISLQGTTYYAFRGIWDSTDAPSMTNMNGSINPGSVYHIKMWHLSAAHTIFLSIYSVVDGADSELISSANLSVRTLTSDFTQEVRFGLLSKFYASESPMSGPGYAMSNVKVE